jgi:hypothetical protein
VALFLTLDGGDDRLSRNVSKDLTRTLPNTPDEPTSLLMIFPSISGVLKYPWSMICGCMFCYVVLFLLCYFYYYVMCSLLVMGSLLGYLFFVSLSILIVMYVPFCVIVLFCVLFV